MNTVDRPNRDALNSALDIYRDALRSFIVRCLKKVQGTQVEDVIRNALNDRQAEQFSQNLRQNDDIEAAIDINDFPLLINRNWHDIFREQFDGEMTVQNRLWLIKEARDKAAHPGQQDMDAEYVRTNLYQIVDVLDKINVPTQKQAVEKIRAQLVNPASQSDLAITPAQEQSEPTTQPSRSSGNLTPWREVIRPNTDVQQGIFQEAEFAADLQQVYDGRASATNYGNPVSFFNHTYITPGIRTLLVNTLKRLSGNGGDPVIQTKTGFGGGKTHSLIALYHLVNSTDALINPTGNGQSEQTYNEIRGLMEEARAGHEQRHSSPRRRARWNVSFIHRYNKDQGKGRPAKYTMGDDGLPVGWTGGLRHSRSSRTPRHSTRRCSTRSAIRTCRTLCHSY